MCHLKFEEEGRKREMEKERGRERRRRRRRRRREREREGGREIIVTVITFPIITITSKSIGPQCTWVSV